MGLVLISIDKALLAFTLVFVSSALWPKLPHLSLIIISILLVCLCFYYSVSSMLTGALLGFVWAASMGYWYTTWQLNNSIFNQNIIVEGRVSSIASVQQALSAASELKAQHHAIRFNLVLTKAGKTLLTNSPEVRISWYRPTQIPQQGQYYRFLVNLKAPTGLANPHTFHYQTWLASKNIVATGYVIDSKTNLLLIEGASLRQRSINALSQMALEHGAWLQALSFGYRGDLSDSDWQLLQKSGTAHLFAISGLHVGIVFGYCLLVFSKPLALGISFLGLQQRQVGKVSTVVAAGISTIYAYLAGFEVPVLRAILALLLWTYLLTTGAHWRIPAVFLYLVATFFILFPFSILGVSFWFSFIAVLSIWLFVWRFMPRGRLSRITKIRYVFYLQVWLCVVTMPLTVYIFNQLPLLALFANILLVPWVSFVLVPLCLIATFLMLVGSPESLTHLIYTVADRAMALTLFIMRKTVEFSDLLVFSKISIDTSSLSIMVLALLIALLPFWRFKRRLILLCAVVLLHRAQTTAYLHPTLTVFDVGQGSSALFRFTDKKGDEHAWLFDTGARFPSGFSMAQSVILPTLEHYQIDRLNAVFLSHLDNDHAGGLNILTSKLQVDSVLTPEHLCSVDTFDYRQLTQSDIQIEVLWPMRAKSGSENNHSCVIKLTVNGVKILFTGDIEHQTEDALMSLYQGSQALAADILIVPHHGSKTSSTNDFVKAVSPKYAVFTAAHPNRWGFPHDKVLARYHEEGSQRFITGKQGSIKFVFAPNETKVLTYREHSYDRWYFKAPN